MRALGLTIVLAVGSGLLTAASWTEDQGELGGEEDLLALGVDVEEKMGPPIGSPITGAALESQTEVVATSLRCPVCQGLSVADSPSESARNMKRQIRAMVAAGYDRDQITDYFSAAYGDFVLMAPEKVGFNLVVWLFPLVFFGVGGLLGVAAIRRGAARSASQPAPGPEEERPASAPSPSPSSLAPWIEKIRAEASEE